MQVVNDGDGLIALTGDGNYAKEDSKGDWNWISPTKTLVFRKRFQSEGNIKVQQCI